MLLSAVSLLVVAQSSSEIPEGLMNNPVFADARITYFVLRIELWKSFVNSGEIIEPVV